MIDAPIRAALHCASIALLCDGNIPMTQPETPHELVVSSSHVLGQLPALYSSTKLLMALLTGFLKQHLNNVIPRPVPEI
jgi:hypothetical protein